MDLSIKVIGDKARNTGCGPAMPSLECRVEESPIHLGRNWEWLRILRAASTGSMLGDYSGCAMWN